MWILWLFLALLAVGCSSDKVAVQPASACGILFLGTSLTAGYGLADTTLTYPFLLADSLRREGHPYNVRSSGVAGETSAELLERVGSVLRGDSAPRRVVVIETGANDMLRGLSPTDFAVSLRAILDSTRVIRPDAAVLLLEVDPGGARYLPGTGGNGGAIMDSLSAIAQSQHLLIVPDLLHGVRSGIRWNPDYTQEDGAHPNAAGEPFLARNVWPELVRALQAGGCEATR